MRSQRLWVFRRQPLGFVPSSPSFLCHVLTSDFIIRQRQANISIKIDTTKEFATDSDPENDTEQHSVVMMVCSSPAVSYSSRAYGVVDARLYDS